MREHDPRPNTRVFRLCCEHLFIRQLFLGKPHGPAGFATEAEKRFAVRRPGAAHEEQIYSAQRNRPKVTETMRWKTVISLMITRNESVSGAASTLEMS